MYQELKRNIKCPDCSGSGVVDGVDFDTGTHHDVVCVTCLGFGMVDREWLECINVTGDL